MSEAWWESNPGDDDSRDRRGRSTRRKAKCHCGVRALGRFGQAFGGESGASKGGDDGAENHAMSTGVNDFDSGNGFMEVKVVADDVGKSFGSAGVVYDNVGGGDVGVVKATVGDGFDGVKGLQMAVGVPRRQGFRGHGRCCGACCAYSRKGGKQVVQGGAGANLGGDRVFEGKGCVKAQGVADVSVVKAEGGAAFDGGKGFQKAR